MKRSFLIGVWVILLALLGFSLLLGNWGNLLASTILIFAVAVLKAALVAFYYMRLKWEPGFILAFLLGGVGLILILFFSLVPDIIYVYGG